MSSLSSRKPRDPRKPRVMVTDGRTYLLQSQHSRVFDRLRHRNRSSRITGRVDPPLSPPAVSSTRPSRMITNRGAPKPPVGVPPATLVSPARLVLPAGYSTRPLPPIPKTRPTPKPKKKRTFPNKPLPPLPCIRVKSLVPSARARHDFSLRYDRMNRGGTLSKKYVGMRKEAAVDLYMAGWTARH